MNSRNAVKYSVTLSTATLLLLIASSSVAAARCQISNVSFAYPQQAMPDQQIQVDTTVAGSCATSGQDYYSVRVDLVDRNSNLIISSSSTPIGYNVSNFIVTAKNSAATPSENTTWPLQAYVYVVRAGGTYGAYLLDHTTVENLTIQVGPAPVPEYPRSSAFAVIVALTAVAVIISRTRHTEARANLGVD